MVKRRVLHNVEISLIAAVDAPCQQGARVAVIKRAPAPQPVHFPAIGDPAAIEKALAAMKAQADAQRVALAKLLNGDERKEPMSDNTFMARVYEIEARDGRGRMQAMQKARQEHPDAFEAFNSSTETTRRLEKARAERSNGIDVSKARTAFMAKVLMIEGRDKKGRVAAMQRARVEHPAEYEAFRAA
jgi:hypothetical protein